MKEAHSLMGAERGLRKTLCCYRLVVRLTFVECIDTVDAVHIVEAVHTVHAVVCLKRNGLTMRGLPSVVGGTFRYLWYGRSMRVVGRWLALIPS